MRELLDPDVAAHGQVQDRAGQIGDVDRLVDECADLAGVDVVGRGEAHPAVLPGLHRGVVALGRLLAQRALVAAAEADQRDQPAHQDQQQEAEHAGGGRGDLEGRGQ